MNKCSPAVNKCSSAVNIEQNAASRARAAPSPAEVSAGKTAGQCRKIGRPVQENRHFRQCNPLTFSGQCRKCRFFVLVLLPCAYLQNGKDGHEDCQFAS